MKRWGRATGVAAVLVATAACSPSTGAPDDSVEPRLPTVVNAPGTWSDDDGVRGPVAAIGIAERTRPEGIFGKLEGLQYFTVSAVDGLATWLEPSDRVPVYVDRTAAFALSPDGRWVAWTNSVPYETHVEQDLRFPFELDEQANPWEGWLAGWSVMDTTTGEVRDLADPRFTRVRSEMPELQFSGDSRYLTTSYEPPRREGSQRTRGHQLVAWDVTDGTHVVLEKPGERLVPVVGSAPSGIVWSHGDQVFRADPATGERTSVTLPDKATVASWGPDGSFAYSEGGSTVHVGASVEEAIEREVALPDGTIGARRLIWQDSSHLVVDDWRNWVDVIDLASGTSERIDLDGHGRVFNPPDLATALWERPLRDPLDPVGTGDPRVLWRWGVLAALVLGCAYVARRVRSGLLPPTSR